MQEAELIEANSQYAQVRYLHMREDTVESKYLAPGSEQLPHESLDQQFTNADNIE